MAPLGMFGTFERGHQHLPSAQVSLSHSSMPLPPARVKGTLGMHLLTCGHCRSLAWGSGFPITCVCRGGPGNKLLIHSPLALEGRSNPADSGVDMETPARVCTWVLVLSLLLLHAGLQTATVPHEVAATLPPGFLCVSWGAGRGWVEQG